MVLRETDRGVERDREPSFGSSLADADQRISVIVVGGQETVALAAVLSREPDIWVVGVASDAASAMDLVDRRHPEVAVMDYRLSDGDGIEAARMIRRLRPSLRVVLLASITSEWMLYRILAAGCIGVISKDTTVDKLAGVVRSAAHGERVVEGEFSGQFTLKRGSTRRKTGLTPREQEVLKAISLGQTTALIAQNLGLSEYTVRNHVRNILGKLNAHTKLEAVVHAARAGLVRFDEQ